MVSRLAGLLGALVLALMIAACLFGLPWALGASSSDPGAPARYEAIDPAQSLLPPSWASHASDEQERASSTFILGSDRLGRDLLARCLVGGALSLGIGFAAAAIAVVIGTAYGITAGLAGGRVDAVLMRILDILYGLPAILLVVLLAVAADGLIERGGGDVSARVRHTISVVTLLVAIGGVSWLTMARVIRGQVLSLKAQPFMEAARAVGVPLRGTVLSHLLPNLMGSIIVYATLTVPAAILSESFLSFLGIGVREPLPSWGNLAADGLSELNTVRVRWWLLLWPCLFIGLTLLALNLLGEALRESIDPRGLSQRSKPIGKVLTCSGNAVQSS